MDYCSALFASGHVNRWTVERFLKMSVSLDKGINFGASPKSIQNFI